MQPIVFNDSNVAPKPRSIFWTGVHLLVSGQRVTEYYLARVVNNRVVLSEIMDNARRLLERGSPKQKLQAVLSGNIDDQELCVKLIESALPRVGSPDRAVQESSLAAAVFSHPGLSPEVYVAFAQALQPPALTAVAAGLSQRLSKDPNAIVPTEMHDGLTALARRILTAGDAKQAAAILQPLLPTLELDTPAEEQSFPEGALMFLLAKINTSKDPELSASFLPHIAQLREVLLLTHQQQTQNQGLAMFALRERENFLSLPLAKALGIGPQEEVDEHIARQAIASASLDCCFDALLAYPPLSPGLQVQIASEIVRVSRLLAALPEEDGSSFAGHFDDLPLDGKKLAHLLKLDWEGGSGRGIYSEIETAPRQEILNDARLTLAKRVAELIQRKTMKTPGLASSQLVPSPMLFYQIIDGTSQAPRAQSIPDEACELLSEAGQHLLESIHYPIVPPPQPTSPAGFGAQSHNFL